MIARKKDPIDWGLRSYLESRYSTVPKNDLQKVLDNILELVESSRDKKQNVKSILEQATRMIFRLFDFGEIAVGLRNPKDGLYRYEVVFGYSRNTETAFRKLEYTYEEMVSFDQYPFVKIGKISELDPVEGMSESDRYLYDRPLALSGTRASPENFQEGDYIDVWMYDDGGDLIGWFELSRPRDGKMPSCDTIRWIEVVVEVCALIVERKLKDEKTQR